MRHPHGLRAAAGGVTAGITFIAVGTGTNSGATVVANKPTGTDVDDLMVAFMCNNAAGGRLWSPPSGWTAVVNQNASPNISVCYKVAGASEPSTYTWTLSGSATSNVIVIATYRGAVYDTVGTISTALSGSVQTAPAITLAASNSTILAFFCSSDGATWSSPSSGLTSRFSFSAGPGLVLYSEDNLASGSTGTRSATISATTGNEGCLLVGIKPA